MVCGASEEVKVTYFRFCTVCGAKFQPHEGEKILFSSTETQWRIDFRWPKDQCECCALIVGMEDYCHLVLAGAK